MEQPRKIYLIAKVTSEGYCCIPGYLRLCQVRGEKVPDMADNLNVSPDTIWYHIRKKEACKRYAACMQDEIDKVMMLIPDRSKAPGK